MVYGLVIRTMHSHGTVKLHATIIWRTKSVQSVTRLNLAYFVLQLLLEQQSSWLRQLMMS